MIVIVVVVVVLLFGGSQLPSSLAGSATRPTEFKRRNKEGDLDKGD